MQLSAVTLLRATLLLRTSSAAFLAATRLSKTSHAMHSWSKFSSIRSFAAESAVANDAPATPIELPTNDNNEQLLRIRHSAAHVMAMAVQRLFKGTKVSIGPWIEKGFYYDFDPPEPFKETDLRRIKKEMDKIISMNLPFLMEEVTREEAERRIKAQDEPYKLEILKRIK